MDLEKRQKELEELYNDLDQRKLVGIILELTIENIDLKKQLMLGGVVKSLPIQDLPNCTRVEVIDQQGRSYVNWKQTNKVRLSMQDDGRTAKIFID